MEAGASLRSVLVTHIGGKPDIERGIDTLCQSQINDRLAGDATEIREKTGNHGFFWRNLFEASLVVMLAAIMAHPKILLTQTLGEHAQRFARSADIVGRSRRAQRERAHKRERERERKALEHSSRETCQSLSDTPLSTHTVIPRSLALIKQ